MAVVESHWAAVGQLLGLFCILGRPSETFGACRRSSARCFRVLAPVSPLVLAGRREGGLILLLIAGAVKALSPRAPQQADPLVLPLFALVSLGLIGIAFTSAVAQ